MKTDSHQIKAKLEGQMDEIKEMMQSYTDIRDVDLPLYDKKFEKFDTKFQNTMLWLIKQQEKQKKLILKQKSFFAFKKCFERRKTLQ